MSASTHNGHIGTEKVIASPPAPIVLPQEQSSVNADKSGNKRARLPEFTKRLNYLNLVKYLFFFLALVGIIVLALQVTKDQDVIHDLNNKLSSAPRLEEVRLDGHIAGRMSYLEGFSGMIDDDDSVALAARAAKADSDLSAVASSADVSSTTDASCEPETDAPAPAPATTIFPVVNATRAANNSTTFTTTVLTTVHTRLTATIFGNATGTSLLSADPVDASSEPTTTFTVVPFLTATSQVETSPQASAPAPSSSMVCGEVGDGSGPCNRPYGVPNTPPNSLPTSASASVSTSTRSITVTSPAVSVPFSQGGVIPSATSDVAALSGMDTSTSSTSSLINSAVCVPPTTVYVTISASTEDANGGGLTAETVGADPKTLTSTSTILATTITSTVPAATETLSHVAHSGNRTAATTTTTAPHMITVTGFTMTLTAHNHSATYSPTAVVTLPANSGGGHAAGKPLGASGNSGGTGNGLYCAVMLLSLAALLI